MDGPVAPGAAGEAVSLVCVDSMRSLRDIEVIASRSAADDCRLRPDLAAKPQHRAAQGPASAQWGGARGAIRRGGALPAQRPSSGRASAQPAPRTNSHGDAQPVQRTNGRGNPQAAQRRPDATKRKW
jgi:ATP-dependent RNA helicase RhlE